VCSKKKLTIKQWAEDDRPREKLMLKGRQVLSDAELLAILLGSGTPDTTAVDLCKEILIMANNDLNQLSKLTVKELTQIKGIGPAKAITIIAAMELTRRRKDETTSVKPKVQTSRDAYLHLKPYLLDLPTEEFYVLLLNRANNVIKTEKISQGGITGTVVDQRIIFKAALDHMATSIIVAHNHPSGNTKPSDADVNLTRKIKETGTLMDIPLMDHLIITSNGYYSFADEGNL
jgi:DNA repair protein RadC